MTNDEARMTNQIRMTNDQMTKQNPLPNPPPEYRGGEFSAQPIPRYSGGGLGGGVSALEFQSFVIH